MPVYLGLHFCACQIWQPCSCPQASAQAAQRDARWRVLMKTKFVEGQGGRKWPYFPSAPARGPESARGQPSAAVDVGSVLLPQGRESRG